MTYPVNCSLNGDKRGLSIVPTSNFTDHGRKMWQMQVWEINVRSPPHLQKHLLGELLLIQPLYQAETENVHPPTSFQKGLTYGTPTITAQITLHYSEKVIIPKQFGNKPVLAIFVAFIDYNTRKILDNNEKH